MAYAAAAAAAASLIGGSMAGKSAESSSKRAARQSAAEKAMMLARLDAVKDPELKKLFMENPELMGELSPEELEQTGLADIKTDQRTKDAKQLALKGLMERSEQGLTSQDKAQYEDLMSNVDAQSKARNDTMLAGMAQRGTLDSGGQLAAMLSSGQNKANTGRRQSMQMMADSANQKMQAQSQLGQMASQMQGQDFDQKAQVASAKDVVSRFNATNRANVSQGNLQARQQLENTRASNLNVQNEMENTRQQQIYNNQMARATGSNAIAQASNNAAATAAAANAQGQASMYSGIGKGVNEAMGGYMKYKKDEG